jgi:FKBP-type peptidyl-prolyl cis-trans isomerase (trigger factor)
MKFHAVALFLATAPLTAQCLQVAVPATGAIRSIRTLTRQPWSLLYAVTEDPASSAPAVVTRLANSAVEIEIPVPGAATKAAYDKVCAELSKTVQIPGFRKGSRLPPAVLEQSLASKGGRNAIKVQAINELLLQLVEPALRQQALDPIGQPRLAVAAEELAESYKPGEPLTLLVQCDVWPEIQWKSVAGQEKPYVGLTGRYQRRPFDQTKLNTALRDLTERYATLAPVVDQDHVLQMGDACTVNMVGYLARADIMEASKRAVPEVSDEFAAKVKPGLTAESLLAELKKAIDEEDLKDFVPARNKALGQGLAAVMDVEVPDTLVTNQVREKIAETKRSRNRSARRINHSSIRGGRICSYLYHQFATCCSGDRSRTTTTQGYGNRCQGPRTI